MINYGDRLFEIIDASSATSGGGDSAKQRIGRRYYIKSLSLGYGATLVEAEDNTRALITTRVVAIDRAKNKIEFRTRNTIYVLEEMVDNE